MNKNTDDEPGKRGVRDQDSEPQVNLRQLQPQPAAHDETSAQREQNHIEDRVLNAQSGREAECPAEHVDGREEKDQQGKQIAHEFVSPESGSGAAPDRGCLYPLSHRPSEFTISR